MSSKSRALTTPAYTKDLDKYRLAKLWRSRGVGGVGDGAVVACSGEAASLTVGLVRTFRLPYSIELDEVMADFVTAPTGANAVIDIKVNGASILSTKITVEATEETSLTAATQPVISDPFHTKGDKITIHVDQVGSSVPGAGLKVGFVWRRVA